MRCNKCDRERVRVMWQSEKGGRLKYSNWAVRAVLQNALRRNAVCVGGKECAATTNNKNKTEDKALPLFQRHFKWQHLGYLHMHVCVYVWWCFVYANVNSNRNNNRSTRNLLLRYFFSSWIFMVSSRFFWPLLHAVCMCVFKCFTLRRQRECERNRQHLN